MLDERLMTYHEIEYFPLASHIVRNFEQLAYPGECNGETRICVRGYPFILLGSWSRARVEIQIARKQL